MTSTPFQMTDSLIDNKIVVENLNVDYSGSVQFHYLKTNVGTRRSILTKKTYNYFLKIFFQRISIECYGIHLVCEVFSHQCSLALYDHSNLNTLCSSIFSNTHPMLSHCTQSNKTCNNKLMQDILFFSRTFSIRTGVKNE